MTKKRKTDRRQKPARPGGRYAHRWRMKREKENAMSEEEKTYRSRLAELVGKISKLAGETAFLSTSTIANRLLDLAKEYAVEVPILTMGSVEPDQGLTEPSATPNPRQVVAPPAPPAPQIGDDPDRPQTTMSDPALD